MAEEAARRRVRMDIDVESNLPLLAFDRVQMQQVLVNLMRNAFEAMDSVSGEKVLWMRTRRIGDVVQTEISRSEEHTSELQSLMRISYAVFYLKKNRIYF